MKTIAIAAIAATLALLPATADAKKHKVKDRVCEKHLCFTPYSAYASGSYSYLTCADKTERLTYVGKKLRCVPR